MNHHVLQPVQTRVHMPRHWVPTSKVITRTTNGTVTLISTIQTKALPALPASSPSPIDLILTTVRLPKSSNRATPTTLSTRKRSTTAGLLKSDCRSETVEKTITSIYSSPSPMKMEPSSLDVNFPSYI